MGKLHLAVIICTNSAEGEKTKDSQDSRFALIVRCFIRFFKSGSNTNPNEGPFPNRGRVHLIKRSCILATVVDADRRAHAQKGLHIPLSSLAQWGGRSALFSQDCSLYTSSLHGDVQCSKRQRVKRLLWSPFNGSRSC